MAVIETAQLSS